MDPIGWNILVDLYQCSPQILDNTDELQRIVAEAILQAGADPGEIIFHRFNPTGISGMAVLCNSHLAIHTFPESGYASLDIYTCSKQINPYTAYRYIAEHIQSPCTLLRELHRGFGEITEVTGEWF